MTDDFMLDEFRIEAAEMFEDAEDGLLELDKGGDFDENYNRIFRAFHSLKGAAGMFAMTELQAHMHRLETFFEKIKVNNALTKEQVDYFLDGIDHAKSIMEGSSNPFTYIDDAGDAPAVDAGAAPVAKVEVPAAEIQPDNLVELAEKKEAKKVELEEKMQARKEAEAGVVYVVDDEPEIVNLLEMIITDVGFKVVTFSDGLEVIKHLDQERPDCILSDINMPNMNGLQLLEEIDKVNPDVPLIFISAYITKEAMMEGLGYGAYGFIEKPFDEKQVINLTKNAVKRHQALKLLARSINYILYQFSDLDQYLKSTGKENIRSMLKEDLEVILQQRDMLKKVK